MSMRPKPVSSQRDSRWGVRAMRRLALSALMALSLVGAVGLGPGLSAAAARPAVVSGDRADAGLSLMAFFDGRATSRGTITTALVSTERFTANFSGKVTGQRLRLDERFHFADGNRLQRWTLARTGNGQYRGSVTTELGDGTMAPPVRVAGRSFAGGVVLTYDGYAPGGGHTLLGFRHVMRRISRDQVENKVTISKFGLPIASSNVIFQRGKPAGK